MIELVLAVVLGFVLLVACGVLIYQWATGALALPRVGRRRVHCQRPCCRYDLTVGLRASDQASGPLSATTARLQGMGAVCRHLFIGTEYDTAKCNVCGMLWAEWAREPR